jgi:hypothetical protein
MSSAAIVKKVVINERGTPIEVILSWKTFCQIAETLGLDLDEQAQEDLRATRRDLTKRKRKAFLPLSSL